ncbi:hypothetical protein ADUPG1_013146, partial [Aduncisulcus paluster]
MISSSSHTFDIAFSNIIVFEIRERKGKSNDYIRFAVEDIEGMTSREINVITIPKEYVKTVQSLVLKRAADKKFKKVIEAKETNMEPKSLPPSQPKMHSFIGISKIPSISGIIAATKAIHNSRAGKEMIGRPSSSLALSGAQTSLLDTLVSVKEGKKDEKIPVDVHISEENAQHIFKEYPEAENLFRQFVPLSMTTREFWALFLISRSKHLASQKKGTKAVDGIGASVTSGNIQSLLTSHKVGAYFNGHRYANRFRELHSSDSKDSAVLSSTYLHSLSKFHVAPDADMISVCMEPSRLSGDIEYQISDEPQPREEGSFFRGTYTPLVGYLSLPDAMAPSTLLSNLTRFSCQIGRGSPLAASSTFSTSAGIRVARVCNRYGCDVVRGICLSGSNTINVNRSGINLDLPSTGFQWDVEDDEESDAGAMQREEEEEDIIWGGKRRERRIGRMLLQGKYREVEHEMEQIDEAEREQNSFSMSMIPPASSSGVSPFLSSISSMPSSYAHTQQPDYRQSGVPSLHSIGGQQHSIGGQQYSIGGQQYPGSSRYSVRSSPAMSSYSSTSRASNAMDKNEKFCSFLHPSSAFIVPSTTSTSSSSSSSSS